jgi:hypothetical protein
MPYYRVAQKNPLNDFSIPGWAGSAFLVERERDRIEEECGRRGQDLPDAKALAHLIVNGLEKQNFVVEFAESTLARHLAQGTLDKMRPTSIHARGVCCYAADDLEEWARHYAPDLAHTGYLDENFQLRKKPDFDKDLRVWEIEGNDDDMGDFDGDYVIPRSVRDVTSEAQKALLEIWQDTPDRGR